jgi:hypothetical protein
MRKKLLMTLIALGVLFITSCDNLQNPMSDPPSSLEFKAAALTADDAVQGAEAGEFSAKGGSGDLVYSLIDDDNGRFEVKGTLLTIKAPSLGEGGFVVTARVEDQEGRFLEKDFELTVAPSSKGNEPEDPNEPEIPDAPEIPGGPEQPGEPEDPDEPDAPEVPVGPEQPVVPIEPEDPNAPKVPDTPGTPGQPGTPETPSVPAKPPRVTGLKSSSGMGYVNLSWNAAARAASYEVYYSAGSAFAAATKFAVEPAEPAVTVTGLGFGVAYNFWVAAKNAGGAAAESRPHAAPKTSDDIPDYLKARLVPGGRAERYVATNLGWPGGDYYVIQDRGVEYPMDERYLFFYGYFGEKSGIIKFVRKFANPPEEPSVGVAWGGGILYNLDWDINRGVIIYEIPHSQGQKKFQAVYYADEHIEPRSHSGCRAPEAVMGNAAGGLTLQRLDSLDEAIATFAKIGGPNEADGRYHNFFMMQIYFAYQDPSEYPGGSASLRSALSRCGVSPGP